MKVFAEGPWNRPPKIILGVDIGTTESAVAFAYLYPDGPQYIHRVTAWPGQETQKMEGKIPTLVYYDSERKAVAFGAETRKPEIEEKAEDEGWHLARHFKLNLHPDTIRQRHGIQIQPLPAGVSLLAIYTDFMVYLLGHTRSFFEGRIIDGRKVWADHHEEMVVIIAHPNGWGLREQNFLRQAAIAAQYVSESKARSHIQFVSEAEASVHFCMIHGNLSNHLKTNTNFIVCDAGGSTIDTTTYRVKSTSPSLELVEENMPACVQAGGLFVDNEFEQHVTKVLCRIDNLDEEDRAEYIRKGVKDFKFGSKKEFDSAEGQYRVDLGAGWLKQDELGIKRGTLTLKGTMVKKFFDKCVTQAIESVRQQMSGIDCQHILLVGGFGDSPYLRRSMADEFSKGGCLVCIANESTAKAVADGAITWYGKKSAVISRATRLAYGVDINEPYDPNDLTHYERRVYRHAAGYDYLVGKWSQIIGKGVVIAEDSAVRETYWCSYRTPRPLLVNFSMTLYAYNGEGTPDTWLRDKSGKLNAGFEEVCDIEVDLRAMGSALQRRVGSDGDFYYLLFTILFMFGRSELETLVEWEQDGEILTMPNRMIIPTRSSLSS
ncbi:unnamed protein product [Rhizoctonia solani]|uniref:Heat shock 70 kDa protein 12A n=1 Tax=Rhizoctonia solani TaxID=456999 RepID=A0A8H3D3P8_9AGAM|nr:unnamed protein product [Rhizoctonia solani]